jgi:hypothetical protein
MADLRVIRICLMLAGIFTAGVLTGRWTAPQAQPAPAMPGPRGGMYTPVNFAAEMGRRIGISQEQQDQIVLILRKMVREMQAYPPRTPPRREIFLRTMESVRPLIHTNQMEAFDKFVSEQSAIQLRYIEHEARSN